MCAPYAKLGMAWHPTAIAAGLPLPPLELANRVGSLSYSDDPLELYEHLGRQCREQIVRMLPEDWSFEGKRALDFGCGAGRTLRHFGEETAIAEFCGCDIDGPSIEWLQSKLSPPFSVWRSTSDPPIDQPNGSFDLIWAISVFTHLTDNWADWLLEMHRLLSDGGVLIATYMGELVSEYVAGEPWDESRVGMNVLRHWQSWDAGGPFVLHSDWWIATHWGRAFELERIDRSPVKGPLEAQSWVMLRKRPVRLSPEELWAPDPDDPRELLALRHNITQLQRELDKFVELLAGADSAKRKPRK